MPIITSLVKRNNPGTNSNYYLKLSINQKVSIYYKLRSSAKEKYCMLNEINKLTHL